MASPPPPYSNVTGVARAVMKYDAQTSFANYDGNARPGELVVDTASYSLYIGNANGDLNSVGGGSGSPGGANLAVQYNQGGSFGGEAAFTYNYTTNTLNVSNISAATDIKIQPAANSDVFITTTGVGGGVQIQGGNNILSLQKGSPELEMRVDQFNVAINSGTDGDIYFDLTAGGDSDFTIGSAGGTWLFNNDGNLNGSGGVNINIDGNIALGTDLNIGGNAYMPNIAEMTTGNTPVMLWEDSGNGVVGWDSTIYYDHANETLNIGNLGISDTPAATGVAISTTGTAGAGTLFFNMNGNQVISFTDDRRVKWGLLSYANIPNPAFGSIIYNNDVGNAANGFYLCADGTVSASWEKIMAAKNGVVTLPAQTSAPTAVAGGIYYNSTDKKFYMCANSSLGWQSVNLT
jgi:hypothetical protein